MVSAQPNINSILNSISAEIRNANTLSSFKKKIRKWKPSNFQCDFV